VRWSLHCFELLASQWFSFANSDRNRLGNPLCADVSQIQLDSSPISWLTVMTFLTYCISIVVSPPCGSYSFPAYRGSALVKTMPSSLLPLVFNCFSHPWHLLLLKLGFSTKLHLHCLHLPRVCDLCHHPPLSNSDNVSGHHLTSNNKTGCWSFLISFVARLSSVQFCHPCHFSSCSRWLCPLIWTWNSTMLSRPSLTSCGLVHSSLILQNAPTCYVCSPPSAHQVASV